MEPIVSGNIAYIDGISEILNGDTTSATAISVLCNGEQIKKGLMKYHQECQRI